MVICREVELNKAKQQIYIQPGKKAFPTLLFLHGGPGWADAPWAHRYCQKIWGNYTTVHWDQRGCNRSNLLLPQSQDSTLNVKQMVSDTLALATFLKKELGLSKIIIVGHSWGALLGVLAAQKAPELFHAYVGIGQLISNAESEPLSLQFCQKKIHLIEDPEQLKKFKTLTPDFYKEVDQLFFQREVLYPLCGEFYQPIPIEELNQWSMQGPSDYQSSMLTLMEGCDRCCRAIWPEMIQYDLFAQVPRLEIPVHLFLGRHDWVTASVTAEKWLHQLQAPAGKNLIYFEDSAHWPQIEENEKFIEELRKV